MSAIDAPLVSLNDCTELTTLSRTQLNNLRARGMFPAPVPLGERRIAFVKAEVDAWISERIAARPSKSEAA